MGWWALFTILIVTVTGYAAVAALIFPNQLRPLWNMASLRFTAMREGFDVHRDVQVAMSDGVLLATDIYLPAGRSARLPTLLIRLPYGKNDFEGALWWVRTYVPRGYAVVVQDLRGRHSSGGVFAPYAMAAEDGAATLNWIAAQPWSDGGTATVGCSALGEVQPIQATTNHPGLRALIAEGAGGAIGTGGNSRGYFGIFEGGIPNLAAAYGWFSDAGGKTPDHMVGSSVDPGQVIGDLPSGTLVSRHRDDPTDYEDYMAHFEDDAYWQRLGYLSADDRFATPALHVNTWHDIALRGTFEVADLMRRNAVTVAARDHQYVVIGPGLHCAPDAPFLSGRVGDLQIDPDAAINLDTIYAAWLDHWLRGGPPLDLAPYTYFVLGANRWDTASEWPPSDVESMELHLGKGPDGGTLSTIAGPQNQMTYRYNPTDPTPSIGGPICCTGGLNLPAGPLDQSANAVRSDVLGFASASLDDPLTIVGDVRAQIAFSSDAPDTDLVAILLDIHPDDRMIAIQQGALRLRYRDGWHAAAPLLPGEVVTATVIFPPIAYEVAAGNRIGLHLSSASFPRLERNLNTGGPNYLATGPRTAINTVYLGGAQGSFLILPVQSDTQDAANREN